MAQRTSSLRVFLGGFLITAGALLLISRLPFMEFGIEVDLWDLWPLFMIAVGVSSLVRREWTSGIVLLALGGAFLVSQLSPDIDFGDLAQHWPVVLVFIGASLVLRSVLPPVAKKRKPPSQIGGTAFLRAAESVVESDAYLGNDLIAILGGHKIDLRHARLAPEGAVIDVFAFWGGIELIVPPDMPVDMRVFPLMGGADDSSQPPEAVAKEAPRLIVRGFVWMAGIEIKN